MFTLFLDLEPVPRFESFPFHLSCPLIPNFPVVFLRRLRSSRFRRSFAFLPFSFVSLPSIPIRSPPPRDPESAACFAGVRPRNAFIWTVPAGRISYLAMPWWPGAAARRSGTCVCSGSRVPSRDHGKYAHAPATPTDFSLLFVLHAHCPRVREIASFGMHAHFALCLSPG